MEREPLLPCVSPGNKLSPLSITPPSLCPLLEDGEITLPLTTTQLKDRLIFGPSPSAIDSSSEFIDALALATNSPCSFPLSDPPPDQPSCFTDLTRPLIKTNLHRSKTAPAMAAINEVDHKPIPKPQFASTSIVRQSFVLLVIYLTLGVLIYSFNRENFSVTETHPVVDALYFCIVTMCTIGYGDITPTTTPTKVFSIMFVLVGFGFVDILLTGMVSYVLDLQESMLLRAVKGGGGHDARSYFVDVKKGRMRIRMKVALALGVVILCIGVGTAVMHFVERLGWLDSFYLSVMSVTTVGYGDHAFKSLQGRLFASIWLLVSTLAVARAFLYLAEARLDKRHRMMAKWVLHHDMTIAEFLAADIDNNGCVSKSEFVIYKLKEMGKIAEKDILQICNQFDRLDTGNCGKITLADLMENHR
ncbi:PREDICTED: two-pore potassium channel 3-like isoform X1 [Nelumbo nucifera]|uniref:Two-pore potassium channel 3-like isoform X1 n=1 Tax=Nelumbo nucifera TaxID=4432 RepID=A0A1U7Z7V7_NELNU|nr:PREDICTED: two-pore potassium channel 3-like isoform X1 [Nelumbo nucifera]